MAVSSIIAAACVTSVVFVSRLYVQANNAADAHLLALQTMQAVRTKVTYALSARIRFAKPDTITTPESGPAYDAVLYVQNGRMVYAEKNTTVSQYTENPQALFASLRPDMAVHLTFSSAGDMVLHVRVEVSKNGTVLSGEETDVILNNLDPSLGVPALQTGEDVVKSAAAAGVSVQEGHALEFGRQS